MGSMGDKEEGQSSDPVQKHTIACTFGRRAPQGLILTEVQTRRGSNTNCACEKTAKLTEMG